MKILLLLTASLLLVTFGFAQEPSGETLEGIVVDNVTRKPLAGVMVSIERSRASTTTDSGGHFSFSGLSPGTHDLRLTRDDYIPMKFEGFPGASLLRTPLVIPMFQVPSRTLDNMPIYRPDSTIHYRSRIYDPTKRTRPDSLR